MLDLSKEFLDKDLDLFTLSDTKKLANIIKYHSDLYYNREDPIISDEQYDFLFKKLEFLEDKFLLNTEDKQSLKVGSSFLESSFEKVKHSKPMISLDNTYNDSDLIDFDERTKKQLKNIFDNDSNSYCSYNLEYILEFKFDGLGVELIYKDGNLTQAITRGDGNYGEDVTQNIMQISNIPKKINYEGIFEVRGEVVMPISSFEEINRKAKESGEKVFSNPRNAASGSVRMKDNRVTKQRNLKFFAYDVSNLSFYNNSNTYFEIIKSLESLGFEISSYFEKLNGITEVIDSINSFGDRKNTLDFEIDGLVLKLNNLNFWEKIGRTEHHPKYAISYKFPAQIFTTKIISVDHQVGRTGTLTPVANLEPVLMGGAIIKRATLHNYEEVFNLGVKIGDNVFIKRAGEVIPKIISVVSRDSKTRETFSDIKIPKICPSCGSKVQKDEDKVRYYCPNIYHCESINLERLIFAVGKSGFDIDGLGRKQVELFLKEGLIKNLSDIFKLESKKDLILNFEGFKEKSVENLIKGVERSRKLDIFKFISALGIYGVGKKTAKTLGKLFSSSDDLLNFSYSVEDLENLEDIGPETALNVVDYFSNDYNAGILKELVYLLDIGYYNVSSLSENMGNSFFYGKKVCITGSFLGEDGNKVSRDSLVEKLENVGGEFVSSVSKNTDFLLAGDKAGSKLEKAKIFDVSVINLSYFLGKI